MEIRSMVTLELVEKLTYKGFGVASIICDSPKHRWNIGPAGCTTPTDENGNIKGDGKWGPLPEGTIKFYLNKIDLVTHDMKEHTPEHKNGDNTWYFQEVVDYMIECATQAMEAK